MSRQRSRVRLPSSSRPYSSAAGPLTINRLPCAPCSCLRTLVMSTARALPWKLFLSRKILSRIARFVSVQKKYSTIIRPAVFLCHHIRLNYIFSLLAKRRCLAGQVPVVKRRSFQTTNLESQVRILPGMPGKFSPVGVAAAHRSYKAKAGVRFPHRVRRSWCSGLHARLWP